MPATRSQLGPLVDRLNQKMLEHDTALSGLQRQGGWLSPTFQNAWVNYGSFQLAGYYKDSLGWVHLRGLIKNGTVGQTAFTLPAGYRPAGAELFIALASAGASPVVGRLDVYTDGTVQVISGGNNFFSLSGITFLGEL